MLESIIGKIIDFIISDWWDNIVFWRIFAIVLFFSALFTYMFKNRLLRILLNEERRTHDKEVFCKSNELLNENQLTNWIELLGTNRMLVGQSKKAMAYVYFFQEEGNQYLDSKLKKACLNYVKKLDELLLFTAEHFFVYPDNQPTDNIDNNQLALYPEILHGAPNTPEYQHAVECQRRLHSILDKLKSNHQRYRALIKNKLML